MNEAFITGSRAYGTPRPDSDIDLVIKCSHDDLVLLNSFGGKSTWNPNNVSANLHFDNLNIIAISSDIVYEAWRLTNEELLKRKPVTRETAKTEFKKSIDQLILDAYAAQAAAKEDPCPS